MFYRFFRYTLFLCLPVYTLLPIYCFVVNKLRKRLVQTETTRGLSIYPAKHWVFRPFQGIGIGLLFETKLLTTLQIITGEATRPFLLSGGQFHLGRMLVISGITVVISMLLSLLWTLDDVGVRYINRRDQEIRMIGKYVGTIMPVLFGFYGVFSLITDFSAMQVFIYLMKTALILYPPFLVFTILHGHFVKNRAASFSQKAPLKRGGIW